VARAVHRESLRRDGPFVQVNCAAIPDDLIESELFGHEKGSFTGASDRQIGKFEQADKGTIFLDEIGDMSLKTQAKVLRVLQEQELERLGSNRLIKVDVRVIAATNKDLEQEITKGTFQVKPGSLFPALHRMEEAGWLVSSWGVSENNRRAKYYRLTKAGRDRLGAERREWERIATAMASALQES